MAEQKVLDTRTIITYNDDGTCTIQVKYDGNKNELPNTILAFIAETNGKIINKNFKQGELIILVKNFPSNIGYSIDNKGNLILFVNTGDGTKYNINDMGELEYLKEI